MLKAVKFPEFSDAACVKSGFGPDLWFPESNRSAAGREAEIELASSICKFCKHQFECLDFARSEGIREGIWGGVLVSEMPTLVSIKETNTRQLKLNAVRQAVRNGFKLADACSDVGISEKTYYRYLDHEKNGWPRSTTQRKETP